MSSLQQSQLQKSVADIRSLCGDAQQFLLKFSPALQKQCSQSLERVYYGQAPSIVNLTKAYNHELYEVWFMAQIENLNSYCNVREKMSIDHMRELANVVLCNYPYLKISELLLFFWRLKSGEYGEFYGAVDPLKISTALVKFGEQRRKEMTAIQNKRNEAQLEIKRLEWAKTAVTRQQYEQLKNNS